MDAMMERGGGVEKAPERQTESPRVFLSKADLGGKTCRAGDTLTLRVTDVDPESGDVEAEIAGYGETDETPGYMADFDKAVPEEEGEGY